MIIYLGEPLLTRSSSLPESHNAAGRHCFLFGLASGGVYQAIEVTFDAGELLPHRFTLTTQATASSHPVRRYAFCGTVPNPATGRRYRPPCPTKPGLSSDE